MIIIGLGGILSDAACALLRDGVLVATVEEKKLTRGAVRGQLPQQGLAWCLESSGLTPDQVDCVAVVRPFAESPEPLLLQLRADFPNARIVIVEHHAAHAASAYYPSPFPDATVLTLDRGGDVRCGA